MNEPSSENCSPDPLIERQDIMHQHLVLLRQEFHHRFQQTFELCDGSKPLLLRGVLTTFDNLMHSISNMC